LDHTTLYGGNCHKAIPIPKYLLGVFFSAEGPQDGDIVCKQQDRMPKLQRTCVKSRRMTASA
jgi:hypothetical protein